MLEYTKLPAPRLWNNSILVSRRRNRIHSVRFSESLFLIHHSRLLPRLSPLSPQRQRVGEYGNQRKKRLQKLDLGPEKYGPTSRFRSGQGIGDFDSAISAPEYLDLAELRWSLVHRLRIPPSFFEARKCKSMA